MFKKIIFKLTNYKTWLCRWFTENTGGENKQRQLHKRLSLSPNSLGSL